MNVHRLIFSPIEVNTYILTDSSGECAVIDCGCYSEEEFDSFVRFLEEKRLKPSLLLNTHCHLDHIFGNKKFLEKYNLRSHSHKEEEPNRNDSVPIASVFGMRMELPPEPESFIEDGNLFSFGTTELRAIHVPGHSAGSIAFYCQKEGNLFTGDALFEGSIGRTDLRGGDYNTLISSIKNKLFILPDNTIVYPGHGDKTTIAQERNTNPYFR